MTLERRIRRLENLIEHQSEHSEWLSSAIATLGITERELYSPSNSLLMHVLKEFDNADENGLSLFVGNLLAGVGVIDDSRVQELVNSLPHRQFDNRISKS